MTKNKCFSLKRCLPSNIGLTGAALCVVTMLGSTPAFAQTPFTTGIRLADHTPPQVLNRTATFVEHYDPTRKLRLSFAIEPPHLQEEEQFITELQTKGSPSFHQFLTPEEWNARFAPTPETEQAVVDWVTSQGFTITHRFNHRLVVSVEAPVGVIENALNITINRYQLQNKIYYSNDRDPLVPSQLSGVLTFIEGLNNIQGMRRAGKGPDPDPDPGPDYSEGPALSHGATFQADGDPSKLPSRKPAANLIGPAPALDSPQQNWFTGPLFTDYTNGGTSMNPLAMLSEQAYNYEGLYNLGHCCNPSNQNPKPVATSIAVFETNADFLDSDIKGFQKVFPYLAYDYDRWTVDGPVTCGKGVTAPCPSSEATLDVEWAIATSNNFGPVSGTAKIRVYEGGPGATWSDLFSSVLENNDTRVLTASYSCTELGLYVGVSCSATSLQAFHTFFDHMVAQGWTLIAASGDRGATDNCSSTTVSYPSSDPDFVSAGGSVLSLDSNGVWQGEVAWTGGTKTGSCSKNGGGSGGGFSVVFQTPSWQSALDVPMRAVPDLALNMNNESVFFQGSLDGRGGTSIVAPALAGFFAQENAYLLAIGNICGGGGNAPCAPVGNPNPLLYEEGTVGGASHYPYYDITYGCNSNDVTQANPALTFFCAVAGYDEVTGWGSANMMQLAWALNWFIIPANGFPTVDFQGPETHKWYNSEQKVSWKIVDSGGDHPGTGIAGFTQGWDSIPDDSATQPTGGSGDSFWDGPQFTNIHQGCISLLGKECQGGVSQGCHVAHVRGWNNQGGTTGDSTYGPICLDTTPPETQAIASGLQSDASYTSPVTITLVSNDNVNGSGVASTTYSIDGGPKQNYTAPFTISTPGFNSVTYFSTDVAGNVEASQTFSFTSIAPTTTTLTSSTLTSVFGKTVTFTATVTGAFGSAPSGTVTFLDGAKKLNASTMKAGTITYSTASLLPGTHNVTAVYAGDALNLTSTFSSVAVVVEDSTTTKLSSGLNPSIYGENITLTATVAATHGGSVAGTMTFYDGATTLGTQTLNSSNQATFSTAALAGGNHSLKAVYAGNTSAAGSTSPVLTQVVKPATTTTGLASSLNPSVYGQAVQLTATITPVDGGTVTGTVTFKDGSVTLGNASVGANNTAAFSTTRLAKGFHSLTAVYGGSPNTLASTSPSVSQQVTIASTTAALSSDGSPSGWGSAVTITATITSAYGGAVTGTVTFKEGTTTAGTGKVNPATGTATYSTAVLSLGTHTFTAVYSGDANNQGSAAAAFNQTVVKATTSTIVKSSLDPSSWGQSITLTATVVPVNGTGEVTGTVTFNDGLEPLGTATLSHNQASFTTSSLAVGTHTMWASYGGDADNNASDSVTFTQGVKQAATSTTLASSLNPAKAGQPITFTATVKPKFGGTVTGTVTFMNGIAGLGTATTLGTGTIDATTGTATFATGNLPVGTQAITAVYNGNANLLSSTSVILKQTVNHN